MYSYFLFLGKLNFLFDSNGKKPYLLYRIHLNRRTKRGHFQQAKMWPRGPFYQKIWTCTLRIICIFYSCIMSKKLWIIYLVVRKRSGSGSMLRGHTLSTFIFHSLTLFFVTLLLMGQCHEMDIFAEGLNVLISTLFVGLRWWFSKSLSGFCYTNIQIYTFYLLHRRLLLRFHRITCGFRYAFSGSKSLQ